MEIVAGAMVVTTVCIVAGYIALKGASGAAQVMTRMFDKPAELGWPPGVQENDDFQWRWSGRPAGEDSEPDFADLTEGTGPGLSPVTRH